MRSDDTNRSDQKMAMERPGQERPEAPPPARQETTRQSSSRREQGAMKLFKVAPRNEQEPPFHYSNTPGVMLISARDAAHARRQAVNEAGDVTWLDEKAVCVEEYEPKSAMVVARDFKG